MTEPKRYNPSIKEGLNSEQVNERIDNNLVNYDTTLPTKTLPQIISGNLFTLFNFLNFGLALAIFIVGSYKNLLFLGIVLCNTAISTIQEIRSKLTVDKLSLLSSSKVKVIRNGNVEQIDHTSLVLDDLVILKPGNQVTTDSIIIEGSASLNESFITGESENIHKKKGDLILSGSFITEGTITAKVEHIGDDNYTASISKDAKYVKKIKSELMKSLNKIIKFVSIIIIPIGTFLFINQLHIDGNTMENAVVNTVAALIGMIPEGLVLLISTVLAVSVLRLSKNRVLVKELYCIETLARVDTICLDKTGTLTEGYMEVKEVVNLIDDNQKIEDMLNSVAINLDDDNATIDALSRKYNKYTSWKPKEIIPFSSEHKFSAITFEKEGTCILGGADIIIKNIDPKLKKQIDEYSKTSRVLLLGKTELKIVNKKLPNDIKPIAIILLQDKIRYQAKGTLAYFKEQGVDIKIISGDNAITVSEIAKRLGVENLNVVDMSNISDIKEIKDIEKYGIFARVKPEQKKYIIEELKKKGHTVAMTGDGVNDVLALKEADCSIVVASGTDAARNVAQLVLLDSNFDAMPAIVAEGRRTINNIERSGALFLVKTIYASLLAFIFIFVNMSYPFMPIQFTLINFVTIGVPSFVLALEPNKERIKGNFLINVLRNALPTALTIVISIMLITVLRSILHLNAVQASTLSVASASFIGFRLLYKISTPLNQTRKVLLISMIIIFIIQLLLFRELFSLARITPYLAIMILSLAFTGVLLFNFLTDLFEKLVKKYPKAFETR